MDDQKIFEKDMETFVDMYEKGLENKKFSINTYDRHFFLYAKYHYEMSNNILDDLKKILAHRSGICPEYISTQDVITVLTDIAITIILTKDRIQCKHSILDFIFDLSPINTWKHGMETDYNFDESVIRKSLSVLRFTETNEIGKIDINILPKKRK